MTLGLWVDGKLTHSTTIETKSSGLVYFNPYSEERIRVALPEGEHTLQLVLGEVEAARASLCAMLEISRDPERRRYVAAALHQLSGQSQP